MTALAFLQRAPFRPIEVTEGWDKELLESAKKLLGYNPTAVIEAEKVRTRSANEVILARVLEKLDIQPFTVQSVHAYQASMIAEAKKGDSWAFTKWMHSKGDRSYEKGRGELCVHAVGWPAWLSFSGMALISAIGHFSGYNAGWGWDNVAKKSIELTGYMSILTAERLMVLPALAVASWAFLMYLRHKPAYRLDAAWKKSTLNSKEYVPGHFQGYEAPIPAFALQRMLSLKSELPEVTFSVEQLESTKTDLNTQRAEKRPPDPFLIATFRDISAYIDVWDEPKFEGRRTV